ncbi:4565_t:CDS:2 [Paraglomus brasilianum]|uniref:4565_t:CDS:1 n=1 Tax=Paraglomus brasilianum TaxID=144538 RepID=A0A9N9CRB7_9GLOM|nr:4565_t:CDS:2 [Paraglomus brasilianum]
MPNLWFTVVDLPDAPTDKVSLENDKDATDLKRAIKETMPNTLADYNPAQLRLKARSHNETNDQARNLDDPEATISDVFKNYGDWVLVFLPSVEHPAKKHCLEEGWEVYTFKGSSVLLPTDIIKILNNNPFKPTPRSTFSTLLNAEVGNLINVKTAGEDSTIIPLMNLGQEPKHFAEGYQAGAFFVTEQMKGVWNELASDHQHSVKRILSGPMGIGKSYLAWFLAAMAYASGWPLLYIADAAVLAKATTLEAATEICYRFLALNQDILSPTQLEDMVAHAKSDPPETSCASAILGKILQQKNNKTLLLVDEHGALFDSNPPIPDMLPILSSLKNLNAWNETLNGARVVLTGTTHAKFEMTHLKNGMQDWVIYCNPLSPVTFGRLLDTILSHFHSDTCQNILISSARDKILRITNCMPQELVCLATTIGTSSLTISQINKKLEEFESLQYKECYNSATAHFESLPPNSKEDHCLALADMFLPSEKSRSSAQFDWQFWTLDWNALLALYKTCPLPQAYINALAEDNFKGLEFEDALFQQLLCNSQVTLTTTDLAGQKCNALHLDIQHYELFEDPPPRYEMNTLVRCSKRYPWFDYILGYKFFQVSLQDFSTHNTGSAKVEHAFDRNREWTPKNQMEYYLDAVFGGNHSANMIVTKHSNVNVKRFQVTKDGSHCPGFQIIYICGKPANTNHMQKFKEFPELRHISYCEIKSKLFQQCLELQNR